MAPTSSFPPVLSIDFVARELSRLLLSPFPALSILLSRVALGYEWQYADTYLLTWVAFLFLSYFLSYINDQVAWGTRGTSPVDRDDVVVITGGSGGLGRVIADMFGMRGVSVTVLDVQPLESDRENVRWYECDVGDQAAVARAKERIEQDLGTPTVLINNAGIVNGRSLLELAPSAIEKNFRVNLLSHYHTLQAFLPSMLRRPEGGTIVTVASVLGHLGASHLSDYTAAKAALIAMHASLRAELSELAHDRHSPPGAKNIRTILVKPGQLSTPLFSGVKTPSSFLGPVVEPVYLAREIVAMIDAGRSGIIAEPFYARWIEWLAVLPYGLQRFVRWMAGIDQAMSSFGKTM